MQVSSMFSFHLRHPSLGGLAFLLRFGEPLLFLACSLIAFAIRNGFASDEVLGPIAVAVLASLLLFFISGTLKLYERPVLRNMLISVPRLFIAQVCTFATVLIFMFMFKISEEYSRVWLILWFILNFVGVLGMRWWATGLITARIKQGRWKRKIAILGTDAKALSLAQLIMTSNNEEMAVVGMYGVHSGTEGNISQIGDESFSCSYGGNFTALIRQSQMGMIDDIIIAEDIENLKIANTILTKLNALVINVFYCLPLSLSGRTGGVEGLPLVLIYRRPLEEHSLWMKRALDVMASASILLAVLPVMVVVAFIIKFTSPGPIFFRQLRGGFNGTNFEMLKFRSMRIGAESQLDASGKEMQAGKTDPRITAIGRFIRRSSIDELPQLINVLRGDMSLVGPRPHVPTHNSYYGKLIDAYASRHKMKPGLTGWAQLNGLRGETDTVDKMAKRVEYDIWYAENWSFWLDVKIIFLTPFVVIFQKTAY
ncbi:MAG: undecaprenyl-phosphate glucose phosphotransferase [Alphaproteobacteria bacterium]|nr:MAG: undecaprenyl-phosphate glucose phosphotransferase [Alphaproteobacteria bacterium]